MTGSIRDHIRSNVIGYVALFFVFTGGAYALGGKNTVDSGDIKPRNVKRSDLARNSVDSSKVVDGSLTDADVDEGSLNVASAATAGNAGTLDGIDSTGFLTAGTPAGGDLGGPFSNLQIAPDAVGSAEVANGSLGGAEIDESSLFNDNSLNGGDIDESSLGLVGGSGLDMYFGRAQLTAGPPAQQGNTPIIAVPGVFTVSGVRTGADMASTQCGVSFENQTATNLQYVRFATDTAGPPGAAAGGEIMSAGSGDDVGPGIAAAGYARWLVGRIPSSGAPLVVSAEASWSLNSGRCSFQAMATVGGG